MLPKWTQNEICWSPFFKNKYEVGEVRLDRAGAYGLHMSPSLEALRATPKSMKKRNMFQDHFSHQKIEKYMKHDLQKVSKRVTPKRGWRLLGHLWRPNLFFDTTSAPGDSKSDPKVPPGTEH